MLTVLAFHSGDLALATKLALWVRDLGGVKNHECMVVRLSTTNPTPVIEPLQDAFGKVYQLVLHDKDPGRWPEGPNLMFRRAARQIASTSPQPWLWLEPDAVPLKPSWLNDLTTGYRAGGRPFLGVPVRIADIPLHMSGVAIYPGNTPEVAPLLIRCDKVAFDVNGARQVLPRCYPTELIQHDWRPPTFGHAADLERIRSIAVIYHQCKDGSLIDRLREKGGITPPLIPETGEPAEEIDDDERASNLIARLKAVADLSTSNRRMVLQYLAAAGLTEKPKKK